MDSDQNEWKRNELQKGENIGIDIWYKILDKNIYIFFDRIKDNWSFFMNN